MGRGLPLSTIEAARGTLPEGALAPLLGALHRARATGWLRLTGMEVRGGTPSVIRGGLRLHDARVTIVEAADDPLRPLAHESEVAERAVAVIARLLTCRDVVRSWEPDTAPAAPDPAAPLL